MLASLNDNYLQFTMKRTHDADVEMDVKEEQKVEEKDEGEGGQGDQQQLEGHVALEGQELHALPFERVLELISQHALTKDNNILSINLKRNRFSVMGMGLYTFTCLRILDLSRNKITSLAPGISQLVQLEQLILLSNKLKLSTIPLEELVDMPRLAHVDLRCKASRPVFQQSRHLRIILSSHILWSVHEKYQNVTGKSCVCVNACMCV